MIQTETLSLRGNEFTRTWSDRKVMIERDGFLYQEAVDPAGLSRVYMEALDHPIAEPDLSDQELLAILLGGGGV